MPTPLATALLSGPAALASVVLRGPQGGVGVLVLGRSATLRRTFRDTVGPVRN